MEFNPAVQHWSSLYGIEAAKRDLAHNFQVFKIISYSNRNLCPLQILSYALEISLSIMELQWPECLIRHTF